MFCSTREAIPARGPGIKPEPSPLNECEKRRLGRDAWVNGTLGADAPKPAAESALREWLVSKRLNRSGEGDHDPTIIEENAA
jgi:hypothetical protein